MINETSASWPRVLTGAPIRTKDNPARRAAPPGTCAQLPLKSGAVHVEAVDAVVVLAVYTAVLPISFTCSNRISPSIGIEAVRFVVPVVTGGLRLLLSTSGIMNGVTCVKVVLRSEPSLCALAGPAFNSMLQVQDLDSGEPINS